MALPTTLNTNEIKSSAGVATTFNRYATGPGRTLVYAIQGEAPNKPNRLSISHQETGSGTNKRRRSVVAFERVDQGSIDTTQTVRNRVYAVADLQVGNIASNVVTVELMAYLNSFMASLGASTTILYDGTGNGSSILLNGTL